MEDGLEDEIFEKSLSLASWQEGQEWVARLEAEAESIALDLANQSDNLSEYSVNALQYTLEQTNNAISEVRMQMMFFEGPDEVH